MTEGFKEEIEQWLRNIGCTPVEQDDPQTDWHLGIDYPAGQGHRMHVAKPKNRPAALIASVVSLSRDHVKAFEQLPDDEKRDFLYGLRKTLNQVAVDFQLNGVDGPLDLPESFQVSATRYRDGLTLDTFARSLGAVYKIELNTIWYIQENLTGNGFGSGGRFDFKRLGL